MQTIIPGKDEQYLAEAISRFRAASCPMALTGAGISVGSGIPDFRSVGGLWTVYSPEEYATLEVFMGNPAKAWELYRAMGKIIVGKEPNPAHLALAKLEEIGQLQGIITQNVDNLHQVAGNTKALEIHGDHQHLQCIKCGSLVVMTDEHLQSDRVPRCADCAFPLKPNVVLFSEIVRHLPEIHERVSCCDLLLVIGTSAQVYPAAELPIMVKNNGGLLYEFNQEQTVLSSASLHGSPQTDYFILGDVCATLPQFVREVLAA